MASLRRSSMGGNRHETKGKVKAPKLVPACREAKITAVDSPEEGEGRVHVHYGLYHSVEEFTRLAKGELRRHLMFQGTRP